MSSNKNYRKVDVLIVALVILEAFRQHISHFARIQTSWENPFAQTLTLRIRNVLKIVGTDSLVEVRRATLNVLDLMTQARKDVNTFKFLLMKYYGRQPEILAFHLSTFGLDDLQEKARKGDQEKMIELLSRIAQYLTPDFRQEMIDKGANPDFLDQLVARYEPLFWKEGKQEVKKNTSPEETARINAEVEYIYDEIIDICKHGQNSIDDPEQKKKFVFEAIIERLGKRRGTNGEITADDVNEEFVDEILNMPDDEPDANPETPVNPG